jgi:hypothetical protein
VYLRGISTLDPCALFYGCAKFATGSVRVTPGIETTSETPSFFGGEKDPKTPFSAQQSAQRGDHRNNTCSPQVFLRVSWAELS